MSHPEQVEKWVDRFAASVIDQHDAILKGDRRASRKSADDCITAFRKVREAGERGRDALAQLFAHPRPDVRAAAAGFLLRHKTAEALEVLRGVATGEGLAAFEAQEALKRWAEGTWALDPP